MRIGIIGAGFIGRAVARLGAAAGRQVISGNPRGPCSLSGLPNGIGCGVGIVED